jgi:hypothetical protein
MHGLGTNDPTRRGDRRQPWRAATRRLCHGDPHGQQGHHGRGHGCGDHRAHGGRPGRGTSHHRRHGSGKRHARPAHRETLGAAPARTGGDR